MKKGLTHRAIILIQAGLLGVLFAPAFLWIFRLPGQKVYSLNGVLLCLLVGGFVVLGAHQLKQAFRLEFGFNWQATLVLIFSILGFLANEYFFDFSIVSGSCALLALYAWLGYFTDKLMWRRAFLFVILLILALPFNTHLEVFLGFPLRIYTAEWVSQIMQWLGHSTMRTQTIILLENQATNIDLPCSGVKSLWTGLLYFFTMSLFLRTKVGLRWFFVLPLFLGLIVAVNFQRVFILAFLNLQGFSETVLDVIHIPLGLLGFLLACAIGAFLLKRCGNYKSCAAVSPGEPVGHWVPIALLLVAIFIYTPRPAQAVGSQEVLISFPQSFEITELELGFKEADLFRRHGVVSAQKYQFRWEELSGSMLFVYSHNWRTHHHPEQCLEAAGNQVAKSSAILVEPGFSVRELQLKDGRSAYYWFQSRQEITDDYTRRLWSGLSAPTGWVMVSMILDTPSSHAIALFKHLSESVKTSFFPTLAKGVHHE